MRRRAALVAIAVLLALTTPATTARAQEGTATPLAADPAGCTGEPRPLGFLETLVEMPAPESTPAPLDGVPDGVPVDEATRAEVTATVTTLIACVNAGDVLRAFALYEDGYLRRIVDPDDALSAEIANEIVVSFATPEPVPTDRQTTLVGVPLMRQLPDGRVAVVIETNGGVQDEDAETELDLLLLSRVDGRWLIVDGLTGLDHAQLPAT